MAGAGAGGSAPVGHRRACTRPLVPAAIAGKGWLWRGAGGAARALGGLGGPIRCCAHTLRPVGRGDGPPPPQKPGGRRAQGKGSASQKASPSARPTIRAERALGGVAPPGGLGACLRGPRQRLGQGPGGHVSPEVSQGEPGKRAGARPGQNTQHTMVAYAGGKGGERVEGVGRVHWSAASFADAKGGAPHVLGAWDISWGLASEAVHMLNACAARQWGCSGSGGP